MSEYVNNMQSYKNTADWQKKIVKSKIIHVYVINTLFPYVSIHESAKKIIKIRRGG